ncbi:FAD/NAD(P)-binding protein [Nonomuraea rubra]|uniref:Putative NAD(P)/FAD-binding protein YdhS n=1 Tax=Nonomuraea rubra TaxID=46180 RepID=A0A7X0NR28_9ACTN|nr:FAD/NAD(P)-binding protein [Nonomuraea rubra]MBB6548015.1 putative NAD(P)/FAD-binding protein YdhS [Nonomuraea rubra]
MHLAIIGAGAAAVGLLDALAAGEAEGAEVTVFEPGTNLWRGRAYGPDLDSVLVNAPPAIMSIRGSDSGHYAAWLGPERAADHLDELLGQPLVPRALYGEYLAETAETALARLRARGWRTRVVTSRVIAASRTGGGPPVVLRTADGREHLADQVVVCVGVGTPQDHYGLGGAPGYVGDPYPLADTLAGVPGEAAVAVIGSGLTAVDVVVSLAARGHAGRIALVSRSGLLPAVWQRPLGHQRRHLTIERVEALRRERGTVTLDDLAGLLRAELEEAGEDYAAFTGELLPAQFEPPAERLRQKSPAEQLRRESPAERLRRQLAAVGEPAIARRVLQEAAHVVGPFAWRLLPEQDRERLRRHARLATAVASPMVPVNAAALLRLFASGQLSVLAGVSKIEAAADGGFRVRGDGGDLRVDVAVNAVNAPPQAVPGAAEPLVTTLIEEGLAALHPSGGLVPADPRLHVLGDLAGGGSFITSSIPGLAAQAARLAGVLNG